MTNTQLFAVKEFEILEASIPDAAIIPFKNEILALCEAFGKSGQSGGSAPYTAGAISQAVKKLLLQEPICDVTGNKNEWIEITEHIGTKVYQNSRCSALFKDENDTPKYIYAIIWKGEEEHDTFTGTVYIDNLSFEKISSSQKVNLPFKPKSFYVDVIRIPITKEEAEERNLHYIENRFGECYYTVLKDPKQLEPVFQYYMK